MYSIYYTCLWSVYFGRVSFWRFLWRAGSYFLFCVGLRCVGCRAGTIYWSVGLEKVAGLYGFFLGLCCGGYGTVYLSAGWGWAAGLYSFLVFCQPCVYKLLILFLFVTGGGGRVRTRRAMSPYWSKRSWSIAGWIWRPVSRSTSLMCGL